MLNGAYSNEWYSAYVNLIISQVGDIAEIAMFFSYGGKMAKKSRNTRKDLIRIYRELEVNFKYEDTRFYGLFKNRNSVGVDPIRFLKKFPDKFNHNIIESMAHRRSSLFYPIKKHFYDYNLNHFFTTIEEIEKDWKTYYSQEIKKALSRLKKNHHTPGDDWNFITGIDSIGAASARADYLNMREAQIYQRKVDEIIASMYAQFFHMMASKIEAVTIRVLNNNKVNVNKSLRDVLRGTLIGKSEIEKLEGYKFHDRLYRIWNFIKHNNLDAYIKLKTNHFDVLSNHEYKQGDLAIYYVKFNEELIGLLLAGLKVFFTSYCKMVFNENKDDSKWNYDEYFLAIVEDEIELLRNPLGLDIFSDID